MGMSASQARFLALTARKNNVEFEGQQINQQRTTLSNQSASYYAELCNMVVPTPPSIDNYTKVSYTFNDGAMTNTITSMIAKQDGYYSVSYIKQWQDDYSVVSAASSIVQRVEGTYVNNSMFYAYKIGNNTLRDLGSEYSGPFSGTTEPYYDSFKEDEKLQELMDQENLYQTLLDSKYANTVDTSRGWYVRYAKDATTGTYVPYFYSVAEVIASGYDGNGCSTSNINCYTLGTSTKTEEKLNEVAKVEQDSSGRYISITLYTPETKTENGETKTVYKKGPEYTLTTNTMTDEEAYNDAMNQYNYAQYQYDQKVQSINSKIEIVQQQDKSLELELKQLDTEESAISAELEAVKKVISKNVDSTFKTFS